LNTLEPHELDAELNDETEETGDASELNVPTTDDVIPSDMPEDNESTIGDDNENENNEPTLIVDEND